MENEIRLFKLGDTVTKPSGYPFTGTVVSVFSTLQFETRYVVESGYHKGLLHIFSSSQLDLLQ